MLIEPCDKLQWPETTEAQYNRSKIKMFINIINKYNDFYDIQKMSFKKFQLHLIVGLHIKSSHKKVSKEENKISERSSNLSEKGSLGKWKF